MRRLQAMTRRRLLYAMPVQLLSVAVLAAEPARAGLAWDVRKSGTQPTLIPGTPPKINFGHGLVVPMSSDAFHCLWEGDDRWITYGHGFGQNEVTAMSQAELSAVATMKLYLLTLAFAPAKLQHVEGGGWRLISGKPSDLVMGDLQLPGRPVMPTVDHMNSYMQDETGPGTSGDAGDPGHGEDASHATTGWLIWKTESDLDYVKKYARLLRP